MRHFRPALCWAEAAGGKRRDSQPQVRVAVNLPALAGERRTDRRVH